MKMTKVSMPVITDAIIAYFIVTLSPALLNQYLFKNNPATGATLNLMGGGAAFLAGSMLNKPNVANIGIALAAANFLQPMVMSMIKPGSNNQVVTGANNIPMTPNNPVNAVGDYFRLPASSMGMAEYTNNVYNVSSSEYAMATR